MTNQNLSIVIPSYNEFSNTTKTINNIFNTCSGENNIEIIVIDDGSSESYSELATKFNIKLIKNEKNIGTSQARSVGIKHANYNFILTTDAHIEFFKKNWDKEIIEAIQNNQNSILCFPCVDILTKKTYYAGGFNALSNKIESIFNPYLTTNCKQENIQEVPCVIGGSYAFNKKWYDYINGMEGMIGFGIGETFLSLKSYLSGGNCKLVKNIKIGHNFEKKKYNIDKNKLYYNKLFMCQTILPQEMSSLLFMLLYNCEENQNVIDLYRENSLEMLKQRIKYEEIFKDSFENYIKKFNLAPK